MELNFSLDSFEKMEIEKFGEISFLCQLLSWEKWTPAKIFEEFLSFCMGIAQQRKTIERFLWHISLLSCIFSIPSIFMLVYGGNSLFPSTLCSFKMETRLSKGKRFWVLILKEEIDWCLEITNELSELQETNKISLKCKISRKVKRILNSKWKESD